MCYPSPVREEVREVVQEAGADETYSISNCCNTVDGHRGKAVQTHTGWCVLHVWAR